MNLQENFQKSIYDILCSQENLLNLSKNHDIFQLQEDYLNNKFDDDYFDDEQIKANLQKDILDFQLYVKANVKMKQKFNLMRVNYYLLMGDSSRAPHTNGTDDLHVPKFIRPLRQCFINILNCA